MDPILLAIVGGATMLWKQRKSSKAAEEKRNQEYEALKKEFEASAEFKAVLPYKKKYENKEISFSNYYDIYSGELSKWQMKYKK